VFNGRDVPSRKARPRSNHVPVIFDATNFAKQGGLLQYGPNFGALQRRLACYPDRTLRVVEPSELAVKYLFVILASSAVTVASAALALVRSAVCGF
jgi:hypothetical protein